ncbi:MAG: hypothetical protein QMD44_13135 [Thermodesulfovibrionales bacterium]|nr:hypothetical protein [Thermodesulfovibrionales bacterium]
MDKQILIEEGNYLTVFIPATTKALVFRVKARANRGFEQIYYGPLPFKKDERLPTYEGGSVTVPEDGVIPARSYNSVGKSFPLADAIDPGDMWYLTEEEYRDRLFHVIQEITPDFLRVDVQIPVGVAQYRFQKNKLVIGVDKDFGFSRGKIEMIHSPGIRCGYRWGNDTNVDLRTAVKFTYAEYIIEIPKDADTIFNILTRKIQKLLGFPANSQL